MVERCAIKIKASGGRNLFDDRFERHVLLLAAVIVVSECARHKNTKKIVQALPVALGPGR